METVHSADGTAIAFERRGTGPALVLVLGAFCDRTTAQTLAAVLGQDFTVYAYDRRGRGDSGDTTHYAVQREVEDLGALVAAAGGTASVFGHSSGAALALIAAAQGLPVHRVAAYEPPLTRGAGELLGQVRELLGAGMRDDAVALFLTEAARTPAEGVAMMRNSPMWPELAALAHTLPYDLTICTEPVENLAKVAVPTLLVSGANSPQWLREVAYEVARKVPDAQEVTLAGQDHGAADDVLAPVLVEFFTR
jgi:pimeloyl-ACP methyl ester carboxylesterase